MANSKTGADVYSVTRLNREVRAVLEGSFPALWVKGEISNLARPASGHWYFSLKDANSQVRCAMFKGRNRFIKFQPENGDEVLLQVNVGLYEGRGEFQLIVEQMEPAGEGALQRAFEQLKQKLFKEGLFAEEHKKPLPEHPKQIGVITSPTGAAIRDILTVLKRRYPLADVIVYPVPVQGEGAAEKICNMLQLARNRNEVDVIILARGGGSIEDLWAFNDETLARTIFDSSIPIVSGIGHEIDFTIADFVADYRAATPSAAAEIVCLDFSHLKSELSKQTQSILKTTKRLLDDNKEYLDVLCNRLQHPKNKLVESILTLDGLHIRMLDNTRNLIDQKLNRLELIHTRVIAQNPIQLIQFRKNRNTNIADNLERAMVLKLERSKNKLQYLSNSIKIYNPKAILDKGYSITKDPDSNQIIYSTKQVKINQMLELRLADGKISCKVIK